MAFIRQRAQEKLWLPRLGMNWIAEVERQGPKIITTVRVKLEVRQPPAVGKDQERTPRCLTTTYIPDAPSA
jgi:hypothetical protein